MTFRHLLRLFAITASTLFLCSFKPVKVACIGDSITYGSRIEDRENNNYPLYLGQMLGEDYEVVNFAISGRTMLNKGDHPFMAEENYAKAKEYLPDIVTIMLGTNDAKPKNWKYREEFITDLRTMIQDFKELPSHPTIYLCLPPWVYTEMGGITEQCIVDEVIPVIKQVAAESWLEVIDTHAPLAGHSEMFADGVHPNAQGAMVLAETIFQGLEACGDTGKQGKRAMMLFWMPSEAIILMIRIMWRLFFAL